MPLWGITQTKICCKTATTHQHHDTGTHSTGVCAWKRARSSRCWLANSQVSPLAPASDSRRRLRRKVLPRRCPSLEASPRATRARSLRQQSLACLESSPLAAPPLGSQCRPRRSPRLGRKGTLGGLASIQRGRRWRRGNWAGVGLLTTHVSILVA